LPSVAFSALFLLLPETKGLEPEVVPEPR